MGIGFIDLIFSNPLLLFIVIGVLISFFQNSGGQKKRDYRREPTPRSRELTTEEVESKEVAEFDWREIFHQETFPFDDWQEETKERKARLEPEPVTPEIYSPSNDLDDLLKKSNRELQEKYERLKEDEKLVLDAIDSIQSSETIEQSEISSKQKRVKKVEKVKLGFENLSRDDIIRGVIWSEIINKPKSKSVR